MGLLLLIAYNSGLAHIEHKYPVSDPHVDLAENEQTTQLNDLVTTEEMREMLDRRNVFALGTLLPFDAAFNDRSLSSVERCSSPRSTVFYTTMVIKALSQQIEDAWMGDELVRLQSEISKLKGIFEQRSTPHCSPGALTIKFRFLNHLLDDLKLSEIFLWTRGRLSNSMSLY